MNINDINNKLQQMLSKRRYEHSMNVVKCAQYLSEIYGYNNKDKVYLSAILHDCAKNLNKDEIMYYVNKYNIELDELEKNSLELAHGVVGSYIAKYDFNIDDEEITSAIKYHTTGKANMSLLEKIIYIADMIEDGRQFPGVEELRELTYNNRLDEALIISFNNTIKFVIDKGHLIHPTTIEARNYLVNHTK